MSNFKYIGQELDIFGYAVCWKEYFASIISPYFGEHILEVGAGIGTTTKILANKKSKDWICLEPDIELKQALDQKLASGDLPAFCHSRFGTVNDLNKDERFDTILYIDVLEHIENDAAELQAAANHLGPNGTVIILSPAHQWLFTPFDQAIGHYRRYSVCNCAARLPSREIDLS
jgi:2-polyprenyl-3-methyl-5-hydroxy-6-metoxy-1,4-benzoquinol methylase